MSFESKHMVSLAAKPVLRIFRFFWLTGPLFDKELRVSSRRKRNYLLRFAYVILLMFFVVGTWLSFGQLHGTMAYQKSRLAEIGKSVVAMIVMFQFFAAQIIAVILLSNSISDEIYHRTLGVLMTTPINSLQIVIGKLFSKLLQIIILLTISLPILAIVRVFGGVPWSYVFSSFCITLSAAILAGSISLAFSIKNIHTYVVIIKSFFTLGVVYFLIPVLLAGVLGHQWRWLYSINYSRRIVSFPFVVAFFLHANPLGIMSLNTAMMMSPSTARLVPFFSWPAHCIIMLTASALILAFSVKVVRKVALRQILGELDLFSKLRKSWAKKKGRLSGEYEGAIREVTGLPVLWKEVRKPLIQGVDNTNSKIGFVATVITLSLTYFVCYANDCLGEAIIHIGYVVMFMIIGMIFVVILSVSSITSEKESMAWPILLTTSLDDWQIVQGKALGVFYRSLPVWLLLGGHVLLFVFLGDIHPIAIVQVPIIISGLIVFLTGLGLYTSARFSRTTWAIITSFAFVLIIWMVVPILIVIFVQITSHNYDNILEMYYTANPIVQIGIVMESIGGAANAGSHLSTLHYNWPSMRLEHAFGVFETTKMLLYIMAAYTLLGSLLAWMARKRFRRSIF